MPNGLGRLEASDSFSVVFVDTELNLVSGICVCFCGFWNKSGDAFIKDIEHAFAGNLLCQRTILPNLTSR